MTAIPLALSGAVLAVLGLIAAREAVAQLAALDVARAGRSFGTAVATLVAAVIVVAFSVIVGALS